MTKWKLFLKSKDRKTFLGQDSGWWWCSESLALLLERLWVCEVLVWPLGCGRAAPTYWTFLMDVLTITVLIWLFRSVRNFILSSRFHLHASFLYWAADMFFINHMDFYWALELLRCVLSFLLLSKLNFIPWWKTCLSPGRSLVEFSDCLCESMMESMKVLWRAKRRLIEKESEGWCRERWRRRGERNGRGKRRETRTRGNDVQEEKRVLGSQFITV